MNWEALGAIGELVGALGVVVTLFYLALQIRQNSVLLEQSTAVARSNAAVVSANHGSDWLRDMAADAALARIWVAGSRAAEGLDAEDLARFELLMSAQLIQVDVNHKLWRNGVLEDEVWAIWDRILDRWLTNPRFHALWEAGVLPGGMTASFAARIREKLRAAAPASGAP